MFDILSERKTVCKWRLVAWCYFLPTMFFIVNTLNGSYYPCFNWVEFWGRGIPADHAWEKLAEPTENETDADTKTEPQTTSHPNVTHIDSKYCRLSTVDAKIYLHITEACKLWMISRRNWWVLLGDVEGKVKKRLMLWEGRVVRVVHTLIYCANW
jgi:hypothetical protein